jgi:hypothetical protein
MIKKKSLKLLIYEKLLDSEVLLKNDRYATSVYIAGYSVELALKLKICKMFKFRDGFPESKDEFGAYQSSVGSKERLDGVISQIRQIRNHDLNKLLFYSGVEVKIKENKFEDWLVVNSWDPELRYTLMEVNKNEAVDFFKSTSELIEYILKK